MSPEKIKRLLLRAFVRFGYWPALLGGRLMYALGIWRQWDAIDDHVILGAIPVWGDLRRLRALGVSAVINLCEEFPGEQEKLAALGMTQLRLPTLDYHCPTLDDLRAALAFIQQHTQTRSEAPTASGEGRPSGAMLSPGPCESNKVYIHCKAGRGRSAAVALCYLMSTRDIPATDAALVLKQLRPAVRRCLDQYAPIRAYEASRMDRST